MPCTSPPTPTPTSPPGRRTPTPPTPSAPWPTTPPRCGPASTVPVITFGRFEPDEAEAVLADGKADFVAMGRKLLADPDLPNKLAEGRADTIRPCIYQYRCIGNIFVKESLHCVANAATGREHDMAALAGPSPRPRHVLVVGGGPAGLETARLLAGRGHRVTLWEASDAAGRHAHRGRSRRPAAGPLSRMAARRGRPGRGRPGGRPAGDGRPGPGGGGRRGGRRHRGPVGCAARPAEESLGRRSESAGVAGVAGQWGGVGSGSAGSAGRRGGSGAGPGRRRPAGRTRSRSAAASLCWAAARPGCRSPAPSFAGVGP